MAREERRPQYNYINIETIKDDIYNSLNAHLYELGFNDFGVDDSNPRKPRYITHNHINYILRQIYNDLFKPDKALFNNQVSIIDYNNINQLETIANIFIDICTRFNKSLGLISFGYLTGIDTATLFNWLNNEPPNPQRLEVLKNIQENHKNIHIGLLNESGVGQLATANNDSETGLNWSKNNAPGLTNSAVYILPSERLDRLKIEQQENDKVST